MRARGLASLLALCCLATLMSSAAARRASADTLHGDPDLGYLPVEELSYELIVRPGRGFEAELDLRVALHNASVDPQDAVETLVLPRGAQLVGMAIAEGGDWIEADPSHIVSGHIVSGPTPRDVDSDVEAGHRDPGSFWVHTLERDQAGDLPAVELIAYGMPARATVQVELHLRVTPSLRGGRWQLDLPRRNADLPNLVDQRRVIVRGPAQAKSQQFWIDGVSNGDSPYMVTRSEDAVALSWPAGATAGAQLDGSYEINPDPSGEGGRVRLVLRLGPSQAAKPDHVLLVVDRSRSGASSLPRASARMFAGLLDTLPADVTFDALSFDRRAQVIDLGVEQPKAGDPAARRALGEALAATTPGQGTDLRAAMALAGERLAQRSAQHPLIVVVTDGMLPASVGANQVQAALTKTLGRGPKPELLFVVDDPLLNARGLPADHPVASLAAGLGARLSLETLAHLDPTDIAQLLAAPRVLGGLTLSLPDTVVMDDATPAGLVAGDFVILEGTYFGRRSPPAKLVVRGRLGPRRITRTFRAQSRRTVPSALVAALREADREQARDEGLVLPSWFTPQMRRQTRLNVSQTGKVGWVATGQIDADIVQRQLRARVLPRARACYNRALTRNQILSGRVELAMEFGKGEVMMASIAGASLSHGDDKLLRCLETAAWAMDVPAGRLDAQVYQVRYPLEFKAPEGGKPPQTGEGDDPMFQRLLDSADSLADYQNHRVLRN